MYSGAYGGQSNLWTLVIIVAVLVIRLLRSRGTQRVNPVMLVITTLLVMYATYALVASSGAALGGPAVRGGPANIKAAAIPYYAIGAILGLALGAVRARMVSMFRDPATGKIMQKSNALTLLIWVALFAIRFAIRYLASQGLVGSYAEPVSDALLLIGTGSIIGRNVYLLARYVQLSGSAPTA